MRPFLIFSALFLLNQGLVFAGTLRMEEHDPDDTAEDPDDDTDDNDTQEDEDDNTKENEDEPAKKPSIWIPHTLYYHNETQNYYEIMGRGPCTNNLKFLPISDDPEVKFGDCGCHQYAERGTTDYVPLVYHYPSQNCYHLYRQGYCKKKTEMLIYTSLNRVECADNPCAAAPLNPLKAVWFDRKCVERGDPCDPLDDKMVVGFKQFDVVPTCSHLIANSTNEIPARLECPLGRRPITGGECRVVDVIG